MANLQDDVQHLIVIANYKEAEGLYLLSTSAQVSQVILYLWQQRGVQSQVSTATLLAFVFSLDTVYEHGRNCEVASPLPCIAPFSNSDTRNLWRRPAGPKRSPVHSETQKHSTL